jgi:hypothetical protein
MCSSTCIVAKDSAQFKARKKERKKGFWKLWRKYDSTSDSLDHLNHMIVVIS